MMDSMRLIYVTCKSLEEARKIASDLIERRLAACGNILPSMQSVYRWEGSMQCDTEVVLIIKTTKNRAGDCRTQIEQSHSYTTPCILEIDVSAVNPGYLKWVVDQTLPP